MGNTSGKETSFGFWVKRITGRRRARGLVRKGKETVCAKGTKGKTDRCSGKKTIWAREG